MIQTMISSLVTLLVTVGPLEAMAIFAGLTATRTPHERRRMAGRSTLIATIVLMLFAFGGLRLLDLLHISLPAFRLAGGLLLLLVAIDLMFAHPTGLTSITSEEAQEATQRDIAVFPIAIPLIAGPGAMTAVVLLMTETQTIADATAVILSLVIVMGVTLVVLLLASRLMRLLGVTGINVIARVSGIILAALAMQLMMDGIRQSGLLGAAVAASTGT